MARANSVKSLSDRKEASLELSAISFTYSRLQMTLLPYNFISHSECMNAICVLHFQQDKQFMRSGDSSTRFKTHLETVYLDPNDEFLTQVVIHYMGQPKW